VFKEIKKGVLFTVVTMPLLGGAYHLLLWGTGAAFPRRLRAASFDAATEPSSGRG
jgi:hypothetical protein